MNSIMSVVILSFGLLCVYGVGVFALCLKAGENLHSAATHASAWLAAFSLSHLISYLAITLH